jgi:hypothetical protein
LRAAGKKNVWNRRPDLRRVQVYFACDELERIRIAVADSGLSLSAWIAAAALKSAQPGVSRKLQKIARSDRFDRAPRYIGSSSSSMCSKT